MGLGGGAEPEKVPGGQRIGGWLKVAVGEGLGSRSLQELPATLLAGSRERGHEFGMQGLRLQG